MLAGDFTNALTATFTNNAGTIALNGATVQTIVSNGADLFTLTHSGASVITQGDDLILLGNFINSGGNWNSGVKHMTISGNFNNSAAFTAPSTTLTVSGDFANTGTYTNNSGAVL